MIRKITKRDIDRIYYLGNLYNNNFSKLYDLDAYINNNLYLLFCYEKDDVIIGFLIGTLVDKVFEIQLLYVDNDCRRKGIASSLLKKIEEYSVERILLEVSVQNDAAYNLYKKNNFNVINIRKKYYSDVDAYVMEKVI